MTNLPFHAFRIGDETRWSSITCYVAADLGNGMFLFDAGIEDHSHEDGRRPVISWWIGKFLYQEGIGGREMLDTDNIDVMISSASKFRGDSSRPSTQEIIAALDKAAEMGYMVFNKRPIKIID